MKSPRAATYDRRRALRTRVHRVSWGLTAASQLAAGLIAYVYFSRQARRFQVRIEELTRLEGD